jgi:hypothetical protein
MFSLGWASLMLVFSFSLALVVWEETVLISHSIEIKLNEINFNKIWEKSSLLH